MSPEDEKDFMKSTVCWICDQPVNLEDKVRDHCHVTGKYRGAAHYACYVDVKQKKSHFIPFMFHNFSNYDCHLLFKKLVDRKPSKDPLFIIPKTNEHDISVRFVCIVLMKESSKELNLQKLNVTCDFLTFTDWMNIGRRQKRVGL